MDLLRSGKIIPPEVMLRAFEDAVGVAWWDGLRTGLLVGLLVGVVVGIVLAKLPGRKS